MCVNLSKAEVAADLVALATRALAAPDILVNNAGIQHTCGIESFRADRWDAVLAVNLSAVRKQLKNYERMKLLMEKWIDLAMELSILRLAKETE